jgi:diacylglycerol kinase
MPMPAKDYRDRSWREKFTAAFAGVKVEMRTQSSFRVHLAMTVAVVVCGVVFRVSLVEWCVLGLCITMVLTAEAFNSALERLAQAITTEHDPHIAVALDIASGAVLLVSVGAAIVGATIFLYRLWVLIELLG